MKLIIIYSVVKFDEMSCFFFFFQAEDGIRDHCVTGVQTCALPILPDGLKVDLGGNIYCTGAGGIWICSSAGELLGQIPFPEVAANLAWGDGDAQTLYVTASTGLYRLRCKANGHVPHR